MLAAIQILITSDHAPFGVLSVWLTWVIIVGAAYGALRLAIDVLRISFKLLTRPAPRTDKQEGVRADV